jgi:antitoxin MazE
MRAKVQKWGNSLAVRIPKPVAQEVGMVADREVEMSVEGTTLVLAPTRRQYTLEELVKGITAKNCHEEVDFGPPVGREIL